MNKLSAMRERLLEIVKGRMADHIYPEANQVGITFVWLDVTYSIFIDADIAEGEIFKHKNGDLKEMERMGWITVIDLARMFEAAPSINSFINQDK